MIPNQPPFVFTKGEDGAPSLLSTSGPTITFKPGQLLTPHWHPDANEVTECTAGSGTVTIIYPDPKNPTDPGSGIIHTAAFSRGQVVILPRGFFHYFANTGEDPFKIHLTFDSPDPDLLSLDEIYNLLPDNIKDPTLASDPSFLKVGFTPT